MPTIRCLGAGRAHTILLLAIFLVVAVAAVVWRQSGKHERPDGSEVGLSERERAMRDNARLRSERLQTGPAWRGGKLSEAMEAVVSHSYFTPFLHAEIEQSTGSATLEVWKPYLSWVRSKFGEEAPSIFHPGVSVLMVEYDEIWRAVNDWGYTAAEKADWKGEFDILSIYWKDGDPQGYTVEKFYKIDPSTGKKLPTPSHKLVRAEGGSWILYQLAAP